MLMWTQGEWCNPALLVLKYVPDRSEIISV